MLCSPHMKGSYCYWRYCWVCVSIWGSTFHLSDVDVMMSFTNTIHKYTVISVHCWDTIEILRLQSRNQICSGYAFILCVTDTLHDGCILGSFICLYIKIHSECQMLCGAVEIWHISSFAYEKTRLFQGIVTSILVFLRLDWWCVIWAGEVTVKKQPFYTLRSGWREHQ